MSDNANFAAMRRARIDKEEMAGHGFRAVARTILDEVLGLRRDFIEHQLAHGVKDSNERARNTTASARTPKDDAAVRRLPRQFEGQRAGHLVHPLQ